jgi:ABC-type sugar transport system permease subunit
VKRDTVPALGYLLPNLIGFTVFVLGPLAFSFAIAFSNWNLQQTIPFQWIGFDNLSDMARDPNFWRYLVNTFYFMLGMPISIAGSLGLALLLNRKIGGMVVYRTLFFLPTFTSGVALMILWKALYNPDFGAVNAAIDGVLRIVHLDHWLQAPHWLLSTHNVAGLAVEEVGIDGSQFGLGARDALIIMGVWTAIGGTNMLLYLAALANVPPELTEAAQIDGAGRWQVFRHVVWPQLAPTTFFICVMSFIGCLQGGFDQARVMTNGGPSGTTTTLAYYIYTKGFDEFQVGYASAVSWVLFALILAITLTYWRFGNREAADL